MDEKLIEAMARAIDDACVAWQKAHEYVPVERWDVPGEVMAKAAYPFARAAALREAAGIVERAIEYGDSSRQQAGEIERLTHERDEWRVAAEHWNEERKLRERAYDHFDKVELTRKLEAAGARVKELEAVLEWYADLNNYVPPKPYLDKPIAHDNGDRARAVLGVEMK